MYARHEKEMIAIATKTMSDDAPASPGTFRRDSWMAGGCAAAQPAVLLLADAKQSTCSRRAAKTEAKAQGLWQMFVRSMAHERTRLVWLAMVGGRVWRAWDAPLHCTAGPALVGLYLLHTGDHIRAIPAGPSIREL